MHESGEGFGGGGGWVHLKSSRTAMQPYYDKVSYRQSSILCVHPIGNLSEHES